MTEDFSNLSIDKHGNIVQHLEKEEVMKILADSIPENTQVKDVLYGGLLFIADIIHQMDPKNEHMILDCAKGILECEYEIMKKQYTEH